MFTSEVLRSIDKSILCWLATTSLDGTPNVSPKEAFTAFGDDKILIANIASPQSAKNIRENSRVCVAFVDVLVQKGFQVFGDATVIKKTDPEFTEMAAPILQITHDKFPFATLFRISATRIKPIIAPSYRLFPETTEAQQIANAIKSYGLTTTK